MQNCNADQWVGSTPYRNFAITGKLCPGASAKMVTDCFHQHRKALASVIGGVAIAVQPDGEPCCHCRCVCAHCSCPCLACSHLHCCGETFGAQLVLEGMLSEKCQSDCAEHVQYLAAALSTHHLVLNPQVAYRHPMPSGQFKIFGKIGGIYNTEVFNDRCDAQTRKGLIAEGKNQRVSDLVRWYVAETRQRGVDLSATSLQVSLAEVYDDKQGVCCDYEDGHVVTGSIAAPACLHHGWCQVQAFVEFLASKVAGGHPMYVAYEGQRKCYSPPWPIPLLKDFQPGGWRFRTGKTW